ncbi:MAG TPA: hypothetical protein VMW83_17210, partial [Spirochaetia bacterium]|nr:hypothetical protein [Spirochaetia bacterium]
MVSDLYSTFPRLKTTPFSITSQEDNQYNCIAGAANDYSRWWWPNQYAYWPEGVSEEETVDAFVEAFNTLGYEVCNSDTIEPGFEKIALYVSKDGRPAHAARQLSSGLWTSKLGPSWDIEHTLD